MGALQATAYATGISVTPLLSPQIVILDLDQDMLKEVKPPYSESQLQLVC